MKKTKKLYFIVGAVVAVLAIGVGAAAFNAELFQGWARRTTKKVPNNYFVFRETPVSVVVSPVTSPVTSNVPSDVPSDVPSTVVSDVPSTVVSSEGPSEVISQVTSEVTSEVTSDVPSQVTSPVTSPVASAVPLQKSYRRGINIKTLPELTSKVLLEAAKKDFRLNPAKYKLSRSEKSKLMKLYENMESVKMDKIELMKAIEMDTVEMDSFKVNFK